MKKRDSVIQMNSFRKIKRVFGIVVAGMLPLAIVLFMAIYVFRLPLPYFFRTPMFSPPVVQVNMEPLTCKEATYRSGFELPPPATTIHYYCDGGFNTDNSPDENFCTDEPRCHFLQFNAPIADCCQWAEKQIGNSARLSPITDMKITLPNRPPAIPSWWQPQMIKNGYANVKDGRAIWIDKDREVLYFFYRTPPLLLW